MSTNEESKIKSLMINCHRNGLVPYFHSVVVRKNETLGEIKAHKMYLQFYCDLPLNTNTISEWAGKNHYHPLPT